MAKRTVNTTVVSNSKLTNEYFVLKLLTDYDLDDIRPGQFVQVRVDGSPSTFLRRPISVYDVDSDTGIMSLLIKIAGSGTLVLSQLQPGANLNILMPLGNSFTIPAEGTNSLLVGGGVGVAPMHLLGRRMKEAGLKFSFLLGYRSAEQVIEADRFGSLGELLLATEDGSMGHKGMIISHPALLSGNYTHIFCCGPDPMMKAVAAIARANNIECEVSLENMMACGIGICLCCVENTSRGNVNTCTEGPVFNTNELKWQI